MALGEGRCKWLRAEKELLGSVELWACKTCLTRKSGGCSSEGDPPLCYNFIIHYCHGTLIFSFPIPWIQRNGGPRVRERRKGMSSPMKRLLRFPSGSCGFHCFWAVTGLLGRVRERSLAVPPVECLVPSGWVLNKRQFRKRNCAFAGFPAVSVPSSMEGK